MEPDARQGDLGPNERRDKVAENISGNLPGKAQDVVELAFPNGKDEPTARAYRAAMLALNPTSKPSPRNPV